MSVVVAGISVPDPLGISMTVIGPKPNTLITPDGWSGTWHISETARKVYAIVPGG